MNRIIMSKNNNIAVRIIGMMYRTISKYTLKTLGMPNKVSKKKKTNSALITIFSLLMNANSLWDAIFDSSQLVLLCAILFSFRFRAVII